jgi:hypothetical protein
VILSGALAALIIELERINRGLRNATKPKLLNGELSIDAHEIDE